MSGVNKVIVVGRLGADPEYKEFDGGNGVCNLSVATSDSWTDKEGEKQEKTEWHKVNVWGKLGSVCNTYLKKGRQVYIEGKLQTRSYEDGEGNKKYTTEIVASNVQFLGDMGDSKGGDMMDKGSYKSPNKGVKNFADDIPF